MFKGMGGLGDMAKMMGQAKEMQERMSELQKGTGDDRDRRRVGRGRW